MKLRYEAFNIRKIDWDAMKIQGETVDGKRREFGIAIHHDLITNELSLDVHPHFTALDSVSHFEDSDPWLTGELRND